MTEPRFSIVLPAFNAGETVERAILSVVGQSFGDWELLVVDDASTDTTEDVVRNVLDRLGDVRIRYVRQQVNSGVAAARNLGVARAVGSYIAFLDADDEYLPGYLELMAATSDREDADVVISGRIVVQPNGSTSIAASTRLGVLTGDGAVRAAMLDQLTPFPWDKIFRRTLFTGVEFPEAARFEDMMTNIVLYSKASTVVSIGTPGYRYHISSTSLTWGRVPTLHDTAAVTRYVDENLDPRYRSGEFIAPYQAMRLLVVLLVGQTAMLRGGGGEVSRRVIAECRRAIRFGAVLSTLRVALRTGLAAGLFKASPAAYSRLYTRHAVRSFGIAPDAAEGYPEP